MISIRQESRQPVQWILAFSCCSDPHNNQMPAQPPYKNTRIPSKLSLSTLPQDKNEYLNETQHRVFDVIELLDVHQRARHGESVHVIQQVQRK